MVGSYTSGGEEPLATCLGPAAEGLKSPSGALLPSLTAGILWTPGSTVSTGAMLGQAMLAS